jgi:hypothetical protein
MLKHWGKETGKPRKELTNLAETSKEGYDPKRAVLPMMTTTKMMMMIYCHRTTAVTFPVRAQYFPFTIVSRTSCSPSSLLSNGYRGLYPRKKNGWDVKLTTHFYLLPRSRMAEYISTLP